MKRFLGTGQQPQCAAISRDHQGTVDLEFLLADDAGRESGAVSLGRHAHDRQCEHEFAKQLSEVVVLLASRDKNRRR